jgi:hypothetical protein
VSQQELLEKVEGALDSLGIDHMVTGAVASSTQGAPRMTHDIDFVVSIKGSRCGGHSRGTSAARLDVTTLVERLRGEASPL